MIRLHRDFLHGGRLGRLKPLSLPIRHGGIGVELFGMENASQHLDGPVQPRARAVEVGVTIEQSHLLGLDGGKIVPPGLLGQVVQDRKSVV